MVDYATITVFSVGFSYLCVFSIHINPGVELFPPKGFFHQPYGNFTPSCELIRLLVYTDEIEGQLYNLMIGIYDGVGMWFNPLVTVSKTKPIHTRTIKSFWWKLFDIHSRVHTRLV